MTGRWALFRSGSAGALAACCALLGSASAASNKAVLKVGSVPPGALVSVRQTSQVATNEARTVAGETPLEKTFDFGKARHLWLEVEKRGYQAGAVEVTPESRNVTVKLERLAGQEAEESGQVPVRQIKVVLLATPEVTVIRQGFSKGEASEQHSLAARQALLEGLRALAGEKHDVAVVKASQEEERQLLKSIWRDARTVMELVDPIRLKYLSATPYLETKTSREALRRLGERYGAEAALLVAGKQTSETKGMVAGKIAIMAGGTAASYGQAYSAALSSGSSFFVYTVYIPAFAQGAVLQAIAVNCSDGAILWANKGVWKPIHFDNASEVKRIAGDLLTGFE